MYSIVEIAGHQYWVKPGDVLDVDKLTAEVGGVVEFDSVYFVGGENNLVGAPTVAGAKVVAKVVRHDRDRKLIVFKRRLGGYQRKRGHRQHYTCLLITEVTDGQGNNLKIDSESKWAKKYL